LGLAVIFVMTATSMLNWVAYHVVLAPLGLHFFRFIMFIIIIAAFVQFVEMLIERYSPFLYLRLGVFLPLITVNCAILGASLFMVIRDYSFLATVGYGLGSGIGWASGGSWRSLLWPAFGRDSRTSASPVACRGRGSH
jgi:Na+-transporting NADH:ubiquinone oxidoreductase subunit E